VWIVKTLNASVDTELEALPDDHLARFHRIVALIEGHGLGLVSDLYLNHLEGPLFEVGLKGNGNVASAILVYVTTRRRCVVVVRAFVRSARTTPRAEICLALTRARELK
jgi:phage-related protein